MAYLAVRLLRVGENLQSALRGRRKRLLVMSIVIAVKGRIARKHGPFERSNGLGHKLDVDLVRAPRLPEEHYVFGVRQHALHNSVERVRHFDRIRHRSLRLLFQAGGAAIPELQGVVGRIDHRRRVPGAGLAANAVRDLVFIRKAKLRRMARRARNRAIHRKLWVVIEPPPQRNRVLGRRITRRYRHRRQAQRSLDLNRLPHRQHRTTRRRLSACLHTEVRRNRHTQNQQQTEYAHLPAVFHRTHLRQSWKLTLTCSQIQ